MPDMAEGIYCYEIYAGFDQAMNWRGYNSFREALKALPLIVDGIITQITALPDDARVAVQIYCEAPDYPKGERALNDEIARLMTDVAVGTQVKGEDFQSPLLVEWLSKRNGK